MIGTKQAAEELGVSIHRVRAMIASYPGKGSLRARRHGRDWSIRPIDLRRLKEYRETSSRVKASQALSRPIETL